MVYKPDPQLRLDRILSALGDVIAANVNASFAKLTILTMQSRVRPTYSPRSDEARSGFRFSVRPPSKIRVDSSGTHDLQGTFRPKVVFVYLTGARFSAGPSDICHSRPAAAHSPNPALAAEGRIFVIIAETNTSDTAAAIPAGSGARHRRSSTTRSTASASNPPTSPEAGNSNSGYDMTFNRTVGYNENIPYKLVSTTPSSQHPADGRQSSAIAFIVGRGLTGNAVQPRGRHRRQSPPTARSRTSPSISVSFRFLSELHVN